MKTKYPTDRGDVGLIRVDKRADWKGYEWSLKNKKKMLACQKRGKKW